MNTLQINNLTKTYPNGVKAIDGISLKITNGMFNENIRLLYRCLKTNNKGKNWQ